MRNACVFFIIHSLWAVVLAQNTFQVSEIKQISLAKPFSIRITTTLSDSKQKIILPDSLYSYYPLEWISRNIHQDGTKYEAEYTFRCLVFEDSTQLAFPVLSILGHDTIREQILLPPFFIPKQLTKEEIEKGLYTENRFLEMPVKQSIIPYLMAFLWFVLITIIGFIFFKKPIFRWLKLRKLNQKQNQWLKQANEYLSKNQWINPLVYQSKKYIEAYTKEKWTALTPAELSEIPFPILFKEIEQEFKMLCQYEYAHDFLGQSLPPEAKKIAQTMTEKMKIVFEIEKRQHYDL